MTDLRKRKLEELQRRNFSPTTIRSYMHVVEDVARYFGKPPDRITTEEIRTYHVHLLQKRKLAPGTVQLHIAALRFFFVKTLRRPYQVVSDKSRNVVDWKCWGRKAKLSRDLYGLSKVMKRPLVFPGDATCFVSVPM